MKTILITTLCLTVALLMQAQELRIQSFNSTGRLTFNEVEGAESYRIEWASSPAGPWFMDWDDLSSIAATGSGVITCAVPMCYRVVALIPLPLPTDMVLIPGGTNAGTDPDFGAYSLTVDSFYMDKYLVTKEKWDEVYSWALENGYDFDNAGAQKHVNHPVQSIYWHDCVKWCNARSEMEGRPAVYLVNNEVYRSGQEDDVVQSDAAGYRLPTDAEWEYAARGGLKGKRFPWGDTITHEQANYRANGSAYSYDNSHYTTNTYHPAYATGSKPYTSPVGAFAPNDYGLYDMAGNVREWCFDWHPSYVGSFRVIRGGLWDYYASYCRVGWRDYYSPNYAFNHIGFRTVLPP